MALDRGCSSALCNAIGSANVFSLSKVMIKDDDTTVSEWYGMCGNCDWMGEKHPSPAQAQLDVDDHIDSHAEHVATVVRG
jgi:hypothetical protein